MGKDTEAVIAAGLALDTDDRIVVARRLLESVEPDGEPDQAAINAAWRDEIQHRLDKIADGSAELLDGPESHTKLRAELAERLR